MIKQRFGFRFGPAAGGEMNLDLALVEKNCRLGIFVLCVNRRDLFINRGFAHSRDTQNAPRKSQIAGELFQPWLHVIIEHWLHLSWWAGKKRDRAFSMFQIKPWRRPVRIRQHVSALNHHRLARVSFGHRQAKALKSSTNFREHVFVQRQPSPQGPGHDFSSNVVLRRTQSPGCDHHPRAFDGIFD